MFQRIKNFNIDSFLDSKIAEEQARQGQDGQARNPPKRTPSSASRRGSGRLDSPSRRAGSRLRVPEGEGASTGKAPDPEDFVIGDDGSDISRAATPRPAQEGNEAGSTDDAQSPQKDDTPVKGKAKAKEDGDELPEEVVRKLARLESLTTKYKELLRNYRTAHARVSQTEAFEATLREHTPLANVNDPGALVEFLNQRGLQSEMVMEELKRITGEHRDTVKERDDLKIKVEEAEKRAKEAFDDAAGLRKEREEQVAAKDTATATTEGPSTDPLGVGTMNQEAKSTAAQADASEGGEGQGNTFFSYDGDLEAQVKKHEEDVKQQREYINELETENATMRQDLDITRLDLDAMKNKISIRDREISTAKAELTDSQTKIEELEKSRAAAQDEQEQAVSHLVAAEGQCVVMQEKLKEYQASINDKNKELEEKAEAAEKNLKKYQEEHEKNLKSGKSGGEQEQKRLKISETVIESLRENIKKAEASQKETERKSADLRFEINKLESEGTNRGQIIQDLRGKVSQLHHTEAELQETKKARDEALRETKKDHESAVANLRAQLTRAERDREDAYQMILNCGKCKVTGDGEEKVGTPTEASATPQSRSRGGSDTTEQTGSTQPTEVSTPSAEGGDNIGVDAKKKKKKKSKAKKKTASDEALAGSSVAELIADPSKANDILQNSDKATLTQSLAPLLENLAKYRENSAANVYSSDERDETIKHHELVIEEQAQKLQDNITIVQAKQEEIERLQNQIEGHEGGVQKVTALLESAFQSDMANKKRIEELQEEIEELNKSDRVNKERIEGLQEEIEELKDSTTENGLDATNAKRELKETKEAKQKLQEEFEELQRESDGTRKSLKDAEAQRQDLATRCSTLETEIAELKKSSSSAESASVKELQATKERLEAVEKEKASVQLAKEACEKQIEKLKAQHSASGAELDAKHKGLTADFEELKSRAATLDTDLAAANQLAQNRFKELTDLKAQVGKLQPELKKLREESSELKTVKADFEKSTGTIKRLEAKEKDLRSEIAEYKTQASDRDAEITKLKEQAKKSEERCSALEDTYESSRKDLEKNERTRDEAVEAREKLQQQFDKAQQDLKTYKSKLEDLEQQVQKFSSEASGLREELQLKSGQQESAQSLMDSMQDQSRELATQMKEVRERCESLDEELADAHRLLSERSREGDTMRRLLADVESRAESRVKEMRERMDLAVEERDRAEDEASTIGRRKTREIEELKTKLRDAEKDVSRATEARESVEKRQQEFQSRQSDLERRAAQAQEEAAEVRAAMSQLRDALDEHETQATALEKEKADLRAAVSEREGRLEKLQKASKTMAEEMRGLQTSKLRQGSSTRSSVDSSRVMSPVAGGRGGANGASAAAPAESVDYVYLKNVLLQFLETPEKKLQLQLVPVLGMLLHMNKQDEQRFGAVISAR